MRQAIELGWANAMVARLVAPRPQFAGRHSDVEFIANLGLFSAGVMCKTQNTYLELNAPGLRVSLFWAILTRFWLELSDLI